MAEIIKLESFSVSTPVEIGGEVYEVRGIPHLKSLRLRDFFRKNPTVLDIRSEYIKILKDQTDIPENIMQNCTGEMLEALMLIAQGFNPEKLLAGKTEAAPSETDSGQ